VRLARINAQREKLAGQLGELEATERVLARYRQATQSKKSATAKTPTKEAAAPARSGARPRTTAVKPGGDKRSSTSLSDRVLALANGKTQKEITAACKWARPNNVGVRHISA
jgi:hypothetical protein